MLTQDVHSADSTLAGQLTPEDIDQDIANRHGAQASAPSTTATKPRRIMRLSKVDFSDPSVGQGTTNSNPPSSSSDSTRRCEKAVAVFVR